MADVVGIDPIYVSVSDLKSSETFYDRLLVVSLNFCKQCFELAGESYIQYYNRDLGFVLRTLPADGQRQPSVSASHHFCLCVDSAAEVYGLSERLNHLGIDATAARLYPESAADYAATFLEDPDGLRLEITNFRQEKRA